MTNFKDLNISPEIMRAVTEMGFESATPIQEATLPLLLAGDTDFLGLAATGTGKTAAFGIPLLERMSKDVKGVQALILCPTRELAIQVAGQIDLLGKHLGIKSLPIYGGTGYGDQIYGLKAGAKIVVGTPGRVVDHIEKGTLKLDNLKTLVLDEADEMISMGFKEDLEMVLQAAPEGQANIWLFSATMGSEVKHVADSYLKEPERVQINKTEVLSSTVEQIYYKTHEYDKPELLCKLIDVADDFYGIVFCQTKALVADLNQFLSGKGYRVDCLHGDLDQTARDRVMKAFRDRKISVLIATDVACRGLDVKDVTHVVNYSIPRELDNYVHRIGRTARSGKTGLALSLVTFSHRELIGRIERMTKSRMKEGVAPTYKDIAMKRLNKVRTAFETQGAQGRATAMIPEEWKTALSTMTPEDITGRFLALMLPDLFADKKEAERLQDSRPESAVRPEKSQSPRGGGDRGRREESRGGGRERFAGKFSDRKPSFQARKQSDRGAPWERRDDRAPRAERRDRFEGESREKQAHAPGSRWKSKVEHKPRPNQAESFAREASAAPMGGQGTFKKKKPFGQWKSNKDKPATI